MRESTEYPEQLDGAIVFSGFDYKTALIGVSHDGRAVYDYDLMVEHLVTKEHFTEEEAIDWISYNTLGALPSSGTDKPIVVFLFNDEELSDLREKELIE